MGAAGEAGDLADDVALLAVYDSNLVAVSDIDALGRGIEYDVVPPVRSAQMYHAGDPILRGRLGRGHRSSDQQSRGSRDSQHLQGSACHDETPELCRRARHPLQMNLPRGAFELRKQATQRFVRYFNPSVLPFANRRIASRSRFSRVASRFAVCTQTTKGR